MAKKSKKCLGPNIGIWDIKFCGGNFVTHHTSSCDGKIAQRNRGRASAYGPLQCLKCGKVAGRKAQRKIRIKAQEGSLISQTYSGRFEFKARVRGCEEGRQSFLLFLSLRHPAEIATKKANQRELGKYYTGLEGQSKSTRKLQIPGVLVGAANAPKRTIKVRKTKDTLTKISIPEQLRRDKELAKPNLNAWFPELAMWGKD
jgi:hypothetical protein